LPACDYFSEIQSDITENMRAALIDWLVDVHRKFRLRDETLYITVNLIDRHLSRTKVLRCHLQLVGVAAMLIACKFEEIQPPKVSDFVFITENVGRCSPGLQQP
jgi:cyclin B